MATFESPSWKSTKEPGGKSMANCHPKQIAVCKLWNLNYHSRIKVQDWEKLKMLPSLGNSIWIKNIVTKLNCTSHLPLSWHLQEHSITRSHHFINTNPWHLHQPSHPQLSAYLSLFWWVPPCSLVLCHVFSLLLFSLGLCLSSHFWSPEF